jgi:hypothetical protein
VSLRVRENPSPKEGKAGRGADFKRLLDPESLGDYCTVHAYLLRLFFLLAGEKGGGVSPSMVDQRPWRRHRVIITLLLFAMPSVCLAASDISSRYLSL